MANLAFFLDTWGRFYFFLGKAKAALNWQTAAQTNAPVQRELFPDLTPLQESIVCVLKDKEDCSVNQISVHLNNTVSEIANALFELEMSGVVKFLPGGRYKLMPT